MCTLTKSYLEDRYLRVEFNNKLSNSDKINTGAPQVPVLGPLTFLIYINDLPTLILCILSIKNSSIILYADYKSVNISEPCLMNFERSLNIVLR